MLELDRKLKKHFGGKTVIVTGGTGSIGSMLVRRVLELSPKVVRVFSNDENGQFFLQQSLKSHDNVRFLVGDIRDRDRLARAFESCDIVFNAAALKHVPLCEYNPFEAVKTNVLGTQNVVEAALAANVSQVAHISTDKVVNAINTMGATKLLSEKLVVAANHYKGLHNTSFFCVRLG
ncbi:MAG: SDR family NAD(P)-dependent oxidoreductase, partial [Nitrososphaera sp.]